MITSEELGARLGVSASWVRRNVSLFPSAVKVGRAWRFSPTAAEDYIDQQRAVAAGISIEPRTRRAQTRHEKETRE